MGVSMAITSGTRLGPYEILEPIGAGGMGEVYRAKDTRLGREVAIKVLPEALALDRDRLSRFEREAKAVAALNHPNILSIYDFGREGSAVYAVTEMLEGETLRAQLSSDRLPPRRAIEVALQVAHGLAAAHEKGIVHRDLKPENVFVTREGRVKILDFGLAKLVSLGDAIDATDVPTVERGTEPGMVMGTIGYMSPEQVRGLSADERSDIFSFGAILHEMVSGRRAFRGDSAADAMSSILKEDPPGLEPIIQGVSPSLAHIVRHCLEKKPERRFRTAHDLAFALEVLSGSGPTSPPGAAADTHPLFLPLTRERGTIGAARFVPGTSEALCSARWGQGVSRLYVTRIDQPAPRVVPGFEGLLQSVSPSGEIMGLTDLFVVHASSVGKLVSLPVSGGAVRTWADNVWSVSQGERGEIALVIGVYGAEWKLEWPFGHVVLRSQDPLRSARVYGERLVCFREQGDLVEDGILSLVDREGTSRDLTLLRGFTGMAWGPGGREVWVSTFRRGQSRIVAVDLAGTTRTLLTHAGRLDLQDIDPAGRALVVVNSHQRQVYARAKGGNRDEDLTWLDAQAAAGITDDGMSALLAHIGQWSNTEGRIYLRPLDGSPPLDFGEACRIPSLSGDGRWVLTFTEEPVFSLKVIPTGPGAPRVVPIPAFAANNVHAFILPDARQGIIWGRPEGRASSLFSIDLETAAYRQIAPDGASHFQGQNPVSPDGQWIAFSNPGQSATLDCEGAVARARSDGTGMLPINGLRRGEALAGWYRGSSSVVVLDRTTIPAGVHAIELATGRRTSLLELTPPDPVGISGIEAVILALDGSAYVYNVVRQLSELYLIEGLR
jgi:hypothetical protein